MLGQLEKPFAEIFGHLEKDEKEQIKRRDLFCEGITEQEPEALNTMIDARDEKDFAKLGRLVCSRTVGYELNCVQGSLDHNEMTHYAQIRADICDAGIAASETTAEQELLEYQAANNVELPPYTYSRLKKALELFLGFKSIEEK